MSDRMIMSDLAIVGRASRERMHGLDETMAALPRQMRIPSEVARDVVVAAIGWGAFACVCAMTVLTAFAPSSMSVGLGWWLFCALEVSLAVGAIAKRVVRRPDARVAQQWATAGSIAGPVALVVVAGMLVAVLGWRPVADLSDSGMNVPFIRNLTVATLAGALAITALGASYLARRRPARHVTMIAAGVALVGATVIFGMQYDLGPIFVTFTQGFLPSAWLRGALTFTGTVGLVLAVGGWVLRRRRRV